jgi:hypothetical protein
MKYAVYFVPATSEILLMEAGGKSFVQRCSNVHLRQHIVLLKLYNMFDR